MEFTLNGRPVSVDAPDGATLLDLLREHCGLTSAKDGCAPEGSCGACTVMVEGRAVVSCAQPAARAAGRHITTHEGLAAEVRERWADSFVRAGASQCGFCSPGIVMKAEAFLDKNPAPSRDEVARALAGNLCRCTGYVKIVDAVQHAAAARRGEPAEGRPVDASGAVGARAPRYRGDELALGDKPYVNDMKIDGLLHGAVRFSDHPRAKVLRVDTSRAEAHPGVVAVITAGDVPGRNLQGDIRPDWPQLTGEGDTTRYVGDILAAVAAETRRAAREAAELIDVEYEVLEPVVDPFEAMEPGSPELQPEFATDGHNILALHRVKRGDADAALAASAFTVRETFRTQFIEHAFLEPESALAVPREDGSLEVFSQGQGVWHDREQLASFLAMPEDRVLVTQVSNGGAFGAKEDLSVQCHAALLALRTSRPVRVTMSRKESLRFHSKRHPLTMDYQVGCDAEGRLTAVKARIVGDTGAYASVGEAVLQRAVGHSCSAYSVDNVDVEGRAVYTNNPPCGAMRGFGSNQANFAMEGCLDRLAEQVGIDGWEIRMRNAVDVGDRFGTGQILGPGVGVKATLEAVKPLWDEARAAGKAVGIACAVKNTGIGNGLPEAGRAVIRVDDDGGGVTVFHQWTEMGQGVHTVLQQVACTELGLAPEKVRMIVDTSHELNGGQTTASRGTVLGGVAVIAAAGKLKAALNGGGLETLGGREFTSEVPMPVTTRPENATNGEATHFAYGWATQMCVLDEGGRIERFVACHDVGRVMNPTLLEGQIEGAVHMGLGQALTEEFVVQGGHVVTDTLKSLGIIPPLGMPPVECLFVEVAQPEGPYGAKGVGEIGLVPTASAVAGALHEHDGTWHTRLPMKDSPAARAALPRLAARARSED